MPLLPDYRTQTGPARAGVLTDCLSLMFSHLLHRCRPLVATEPLSKGRGPQMAGSKTTDRRSTKVTLLKLLLMFSSNCYCVRVLMCLFLFFSQFRGENSFVIAPVEMYRHER